MRADAGAVACSCNALDLKFHTADLKPTDCLPVERSSVDLPSSEPLVARGNALLGG